MRLSTAAIALALIAGPAVAGQPLQVTKDQSTRLRLAGPARDVVVANPAVADVTVLDPRSLVVLGKAYGSTHLLVIDALGRTLVDREVVVSAPAQGQVGLVRGREVRSYACAATCETAETAAAASAAPAAP